MTHVIQVGFAVARKLVGFEGEIIPWLANRLKQLQEELTLKPHNHSLCGVSSLAIGADSIFAAACDLNRMDHRVFLPQSREEFLNAGKPNEPDFSPLQKEQTRQLLDSPHVIEERVVSNSSDRIQRFADVNHEIVRVSDLVIGMLRETNANSPLGGTQHFIDLATQLGKPALVIQLSMIDGKPRFTEQWHNKEKFDQFASLK